MPAERLSLRMRFGFVAELFAAAALQTAVCLDAADVEVARLLFSNVERSRSNLGSLLLVVHLLMHAVSQCRPLPFHLLPLEALEQHISADAY